MVDFFNPAGRGTGMKGSIAANAARLDGIENRKINAMKLMGVEDSQRRGAMTEDAKTAALLLRNGDNTGTMEFLSERAQESSMSGNNPRETMELYEAVRSGDIPLALGMIDNYLSIFDDNYIKDRERKPGKTPEQIEREIANTERVTSLREQELEARMAENARKSVQLSPTTQKILDRSQTSAFEAKSSSTEARLLADDYSKLTASSGAAGKFNESMKNLLGSEDAVSDTKRRFRAIRASNVIKNLPPGAASEADVELALSGLPSENASPESVEMFLRGMAKLSAIQYEFQTLRSTMLSETGGTKNLIKKWEELSTSDDFMTNINEMAGSMSAPQDAANPVNKFSGFKVIRN